MRVWIFGSGAVGLGLGSFLVAAGEAVGFVARAATARALRERGLERSGCLGHHIAKPGAFGVAETLREMPGPAPDLVLVCVKAHASAEAAAVLAAAAGRLGAAELLLCQNGWGNAEPFLARLPDRPLHCARVITGFRRSAASAVEVTVHAEPVRIGPLEGELAPRIPALCDALARGGLPAEPSPDIVRDLWAKLLYNAALNPPCALLGVSYGDFAARPQGRALVAAVAHEVFAVMRAAGYATHWPDAEAWLADFHARLLPPTAGHEPSMLQDLRAGSATEIDALSGAVARLAEAHGLAAPVNAAFASLIRAAEARSRRAQALAISGAAKARPADPPA